MENRIEDYIRNVFDSLLEIHENSTRTLDLLHSRLRNFLLEFQCECYLHNRNNLNSPRFCRLLPDIDNLLDQIIDKNTSRSCIIFGNSCSGKTSSLSKYFYEKENSRITAKTLVIHINCTNFDDNALLTVLLERLDEHFPTHRKLFSGHQKSSILREKLMGISKCGYFIIFVLENCESVIYSPLNAGTLTLNYSVHSARQFALYTLVDIMHSPEINLILILSTSMFDLPSFFEKRVKSRMSQRRIIMEEMSTETKEINTDTLYNDTLELLSFNINEYNNCSLKRAIDSYNNSINKLLSLIFAIDNPKHFTKILEYSVESGLTRMEFLLLIAYRFLLITPQSSNREMLDIFSIEEKASETIMGFKREFQSISQGYPSFELIVQRKFEDLSVIQHTILTCYVKIINSGLQIITFKSIMGEISKLKLYSSLQRSLSGMSFDHTEDSYKMAFIMLVKEGIIEPVSTSDSCISRTLIEKTPVRFPHYRVYSKIVNELNIPTILLYWIKLDVLK